MKKLLICASRVSHIENFHLPYIEYFKNKGFMVDIAVEGYTDYPLIDHCYNMQFTKNPFSPNNIKTIRQLRNIIRQNAYDMVYSNSTLAGAAARLAVMGIKNRPYFVHISHGYMFREHGGIKSAVYLTAERLTKNVTDSLVVMNREDFLLAKKYSLGKTVHYIYGMGLRKENFPDISSEKRHEWRINMGIADTDMMLLCVGEFSQRKNQMMVMKAFRHLAEKHHNVRLVFAGEGALLPECRQLAHQYELDMYIRFLGQVKEISMLYRCSDILVTGSLMEGLPFNVMEALYCGVPVVATAIKGHTDLISDRKNGLLVEIGELPMYRGLDELISDRALYTAIKNNVFLDERYLIDSAEPALLKILDKEYSEEVFA